MKSHVLDGFGACFFQKHWNQDGDDICQAALKILHREGMNSTLNFTYIALIPKLKNLELVSDFKPISPCNE